VQLGRAFAEGGIRTWNEFLRHHVLRFSHFDVFLYNSGLYLWRLTVLMLIGCIIALACKNREMLFAIVIGGGIVRKYRFRSLRPARS
jgi:hypothetical protein